MSRFTLSAWCRLLIFLLIVLPASPLTVYAEIPSNPIKYELYFDARHDVDARGGINDAMTRVTSAIALVQLIDPDTGAVVAQGQPNDSGIVFDIDGRQGDDFLVQFDLPLTYPLFTGATAYTQVGSDVPFTVFQDGNRVSIRVTTDTVWDTYVAGGLAKWATLQVSRWCDSNEDGLQNENPDCPAITVNNGSAYTVDAQGATIEIDPRQDVVITASTPSGKAFTTPSTQLPLDGNDDSDVNGNGLSTSFRMTSGQTSSNFDIGLVDGPDDSYVWLFFPMIQRPEIAASQR